MRASSTRAPFGIVGLETAVPVLLTKLVHEGGLPLLRFVELLTAGPARALGVPGGSLAQGESPTSRSSTSAARG